MKPIVTCSCLAILCVNLWACSEATDNDEPASTHKSSLHTDRVEECEPDEGKDECWEINGEDLVTWQETVELNAADWRTIAKTSREEAPVEVVLEAQNLNAGFMPTAEGQGHYDSEEEFRNTLRLLLGVDPDTRFQLVQHGSTTKVTADREAIADGSTGNFVYDAMSDERGDIYIDGKLIEEWSPDTVHNPNVIGDTTETQTQESALKLRGDRNEVELNAFKNGYCWYKSIGSELDNFERDNKQTHREFYWAGGWFPWFRTVHVNANSMYLENSIYDCDSRTGWCDLFSRPDKSRSNVDSMELKDSAFGGPGCSQIWLGDGVCAFGRIVDVEQLDGYDSAGSNPGCGYE